MPYSITTRDGITIQGIPDDVPPDAPVLKQRVASIRVGKAGIEPGDAPSGLMKGLNDVSAAGAQLLTHSLPEGVVGAVNRATKYVNGLPVIGPVTQALGMVPATANELDQQIAETGKTYEDARAAAGKTGFDWGRAGGQAIGTAPLAALAPAAGATALARGGIGAVSGGIGGLLQPVETEGDFWAKKGAQVGVGAATGAVLTPALGAIGDRVVSGVRNFFANRKPVSIEEVDSVIRQNLQSAGQKWEDLAPQAQAQLREQAVSALSAADKKLDRAALLRQADFMAENMDGTLGQITRDAGQFAKERNLRTLPGAGDPLLERFQTQGVQLQQKMGAYAEGASGDKAVAGEKIAAALKAYDQKKANAVADAYGAARKSAGKDVEVPMQGLAQDAADIFDRYRTAVPSGVRGQFAKYGLDPSEVVNQRRLFTVEEADKLLKEINKQGSNEPAVQSALGELRAAVKKAVTSDAGAEDVFAPARRAAAERFGLHEAVPALEAAATDGVAPDDFVRKFVINGNASEVQGLAKALRESSPEALAEARAQVGSYLQRKAFGADVVGDAPFNPKAYAKALRELGDSKLGALFSPGEINQLHRLSRIGAYVNQIPNASPVQHSNNWGAITSLASRVPGVPAIVGVAKAAKTAVDNQLSVSRALAAKVPVQPAQLDPETVRRLARLLTASNVAGGAAVAGELKQ